MQPAKFEKREGEGAPQALPKRLSKDKALLRKKQKLLEQRALAEWDEGLGGGKRSATIVLTNLFDAAAAAEADAAFYANLKQDVEVECAKAGAVEKVTVFEGSERGAVAVRFKAVDDAERCVGMMSDRQFGQGTVKCEVYDGVTDYRALAVQQAAAGAGGGGNGGGGGAAGVDLGAAAGGAADGRESLEEQEKKLDEFGDWLEAGSTDEEAGADSD